MTSTIQFHDKIIEGLEVLKSYSAMLQKNQTPFDQNQPGYEKYWNLYGSLIQFSPEAPFAEQELTQSILPVLQHDVWQAAEKITMTARLNAPLLFWLEQNGTIPNTSFYSDLIQFIEHTPRIALDCNLHKQPDQFIYPSFDQLTYTEKEQFIASDLPLSAQRERLVLCTYKDLLTLLKAHQNPSSLLWSDFRSAIEHLPCMPAFISYAGLEQTPAVSGHTWTAKTPAHEELIPQDPLNNTQIPEKCPEEPSILNSVPDEPSIFFDSESDPSIIPFDENPDDTFMLDNEPDDSEFSYTEEDPNLLILHPDSSVLDNEFEETEQNNLFEEFEQDAYTWDSSEPDPIQEYEDIIFPDEADPFNCDCSTDLPDSTE